jgi:hypothetical protein
MVGPKFVGAYPGDATPSVINLDQVRFVEFKNNQR